MWNATDAKNDLPSQGSLRAIATVTAGRLLVSGPTACFLSEQSFAFSGMVYFVVFSCALVLDFSPLKSRLLLVGSVDQVLPCSANWICAFYMCSQQLLGNLDAQTLKLKSEAGWSLTVGSYQKIGGVY